MTNDEIKEKYTAVEGLLEEAVNKAGAIELVGEEENAELSAINSTLREINKEFKQEIEKLENSSEWDKFCIAFLGETNAGKSTVIETLRIIYDEGQRRAEREKQEEKYNTVLTEYCDRYKALLKTLQETNLLLVEKKEPSKFVTLMKKVILIIVGICIGYTIAFLGF